MAGAQDYGAIPYWLFEIKSFPVESHLAGDVRGVSQGARGEVGRALSRGATATSAAASTRGNCLQGTVVSWYRHCSIRTLRPTCTLCSVDIFGYPFKVPFQARGVHGFSSTKYTWYNTSLEPRLSVLDFVALWRKSCETKSGRKAWVRG